MVELQSQDTVMMRCDGDSLDSLASSMPQLVYLGPQKIKPFPWMMRYKQRYGRWRPSPFQPTVHSFAIQPLLPFQMQNGWSTIAIYREQSKAFSFEKKSFLSFPVSGSRNEPGIKKHGVLLRATTGSGNQKTPFFLWTQTLWALYRWGPLTTPQLLPCLLRNHRKGELPGGPVVRTLRSQCRGHGFNPWSGN